MSQEVMQEGTRPKTHEGHVTPGFAPPVIVRTSRMNRWIDSIWNVACLLTRLRSLELLDLAEAVLHQLSMQNHGNDAAWSRGLRQEEPKGNQRNKTLQSVWWYTDRMKQWQLIHIIIFLFDASSVWCCTLLISTLCSYHINPYVMMWRQSLPIVTSPLLFFSSCSNGIPKSTNGILRLMEEIPNNHLSFIKPCRYWWKNSIPTG